MYPYERFTETSKQVLTVAQEEAESSRHSYIGTEHILLAFLRVPASVAGVVLERLDVDLAKVRPIIDKTLGANERIVIQHIIPTSRVKKIIEISFAEARRMGDEYVGTEHLLLGLLIEGQGVGAHVLAELGADLGKVKAQIEAVRKAGAISEATATRGPGSPWGASARYTTTSNRGGLRLVLFERAEDGADGEPLYVNPIDVVRVDAAGDETSSITLMHGAALTVVVRGEVHEVARRLTEA